MKYEQNDCCDCAVPGYPCLGDSCSRRHAIYYRCDRCGVEDLTEDDIHEVDGEDLCDTCYDEQFDEPSVCDDCEKADAWECHFCCEKCYEDYGECPNPDCDPMDI